VLFLKEKKHQKDLFSFWINDFAVRSDTPCPFPMPRFLCNAHRPAERPGWDCASKAARFQRVQKEDDQGSPASSFSLCGKPAQ